MRLFRLFALLLYVLGIQGNNLHSQILPIVPFQKYIADGSVNLADAISIQPTNSQQLPNGLLLTTGKLDEDPSTTANQEYGFIARLDSAGHIINAWKYNEGLLSSTISQGFGLNDGTFIVQGSAESLSGTNQYVYKYNSQGISQWGTELGSSDFIITPSSIKRSSSGDILSVGRISLSGVSASGDSAYFLRMNASTGSVEHISAWHGSGNDWFMDVAETPDGIVCLGYTRSGSVDRPVLCKFDTSNSVLWTLVYTHPTLLRTNREQMGLIVNPDGSIVFAFVDSQDLDNDPEHLRHGAVLTKVNPYGDVIWSKRYWSDYPIESKHLLRTSNGNILISAKITVDVVFTDSIPCTSNSNCFNAECDSAGWCNDRVYVRSRNALILVDQLGDVLLRKQVGLESPFSELETLRVDQVITSTAEVNENGCQGFLCSGLRARFFSNGLDFDPLYIKLDAQLQGFSDNCFDDSFPIYVTEFSPHVDSILVATAGEVYSLDLPTASVTDTLTAYQAVTSDVEGCVPWINTTGACAAPVSVAEQISLSGSSIFIHPNPSSGTFFIRALTNTQIASVLVTNSVGQLILIKTNFQNDKLLQFHLDASAGMYIVKALFEDGSSAVQRILVVDQ
ncbi:MAG: T9SS type A sorting domain-containing protein [Flavobacteriales bacterium]|nr:T9SS type A sorting domain-containing protein [Flavobacteriales bacterium]